MIRYIAFLRAINVGGHVVKMEALRQHFEALGFDEVTTYIASGNVIFNASSKSAKNLEKKIAAHLQTELGYEVATFLRTVPELTAIAEYQPFPRAKAGTLYIGFLAEALDPAAQEAVYAFRSAVDDFQVHERELYWLCRLPSRESKFSLARLERALGIQATFRNVTTVQALAKKVA